MLEDCNLLWCAADDTTKPTLTIPRTLVPELLELIHHLYECSGVASPLALRRGHFHWSTVVRDTRKYVLCCGWCCGRKRSSSQQLFALLPTRAASETVGGTRSRLASYLYHFFGNGCILLAVDKASKFPFAFSIPSKREEGVARHVLQLCVTFGTPRVVRSTRGR